MSLASPRYDWSLLYAVLALTLCAQKPKEVVVEANGRLWALETAYDSATKRLVIRDPNVRVLDDWRIVAKM